MTPNLDCNCQINVLQEIGGLIDLMRVDHCDDTANTTYI